LGKRKERGRRQDFQQRNVKEKPVEGENNDLQVSRTVGPGEEMIF